MRQKIHFTKTGHDKIIEELHHLKTHKHQAAKDRLTKARAMGDLRKNSEYHAAKEDLAVIVDRHTLWKTCLHDRRCTHALKICSSSEYLLDSSKRIMCVDLSHEERKFAICRDDLHHIDSIFCE